MGKNRRQRQKLHSPAVGKQKPSPTEDTFGTNPVPLLPVSMSDNLFAGLNISFDSLETKLSDDVQSVKSYKSAKSEKGAGASNKILPKKDKLKLRREVLLKKIDTVNQMKKELKMRNKRKKVAIMGDTNALHDSLPSLDSLLKGKNLKFTGKVEGAKKKCIEKSTKRKKESLKGVNLFKQTLRNKTFKKNPLEAISGHVKAFVASDAGRSTKKT